MMDNKYVIKDFCIIRHQQVIRRGELLFKGTASQPAPFLLEVYKSFHINYPKFHKMDNLSKLGFLASELLLQDKEITTAYKGEEIGLILYNAASSIDCDRTHQKSIQDPEAYFPSPSVFVYTLANIVIGEICIRNKFFGESTFFIEKQFNASELHNYVRHLFDDNVLKCCLTGWIELDGDQYDGVMYLIEKSTSDTNGIAIFEPEKLNEIYLQES
jgi:hypothetical protein